MSSSANPAGAGDDAAGHGGLGMHGGGGRSADGNGTPAGVCWTLGRESESRKRKAAVVPIETDYSMGNEEDFNVSNEDSYRISKEIEDLRSQLALKKKELKCYQENKKLRVELALKVKVVECIRKENEQLKAQNKDLQENIVEILDSQIESKKRHLQQSESWRTRLELSNARLEEEIKNLYEGNSEETRCLMSPQTCSNVLKAILEDEVHPAPTASPSGCLPQRPRPPQEAAAAGASRLPSPAREQPRPRWLPSPPTPPLLASPARTDGEVGTYWCRRSGRPPGHGAAGAGQTLPQHSAAPTAPSAPTPAYCAPPHRMHQFHLLDPYYEEKHRGRLTAEGEELPPLRPRTHDKFRDMWYDDRYTPLLERAGLDVVSYQVRRGLPIINPAAITALVDRWRPETHSFHLPCGEMTVTLEDTQKFLGVRVRGRPVIGQCVPNGWRARVQAFLGRDLPLEAPGNRTSGVPISWLRQNFAQCPDVADEQTVTYYCRAWILHLFGCVLFPDATGDSASWMYIPCLTDWDTAGEYSWASGVLAFLYRHLCEACRRTSQHASLGGCVYLLQLWMWSRLPVGRPTVLAPRPWFPVAGLRLRPTVAYLWDQVKAPFARTTRAYVEYANELDTLTPSMVMWEPYNELEVQQLGLSTMCSVDEDLYRMRCPLICFYAVEYHLPHRVARQFGLRQEWPVKPFSTSVELHKIDRQKQKKVTDFETLHRDYIDQWDLHENLYENDQPHTNYNFRAYLSWYVGVTRSRLKVQWTQADYADIESSDDEDTSYDLMTRQGTQVEFAPILDRVGNTLKQSVLDIERFSRTGVDDRTLNFLGRLARRQRRAAGRCGCRTSAAMDIHGPSTRLLDTTLGLGASSHGGTSSR